MDDFTIQVFQSEIETQCKFVLLAASDLDSLLNTPPHQDFQAEHTTRIWCALQTILVSAANISKLLWGSKAKDEGPREKLRDSIKIDKTSPLHSKRVRNAFEHFDEFIDAMPASIYVGRNIGPPGMIQIGNETPDTRFGQFDPASGDLTFWNRSTSLNAITQEVARILPLIRGQLASR
jgi:hypothetical protein